MFGIGILSLIVIIIFLIGFYSFIIKDPVEKDPALKGKIGEVYVSAILNLLPKEKYRIINDIILSQGDKTTQIDHLVISVYGIFVIETKNFNGYIFGHSEKDHWIQNIWGNKYKFYNPIFQNRNHINFLIKKIPELHLYKFHCHSIVVFNNSSKLRLTGDCRTVMTHMNLLNYIKTFREEIISISTCESISEIIQNIKVENSQEVVRHNLNVQKAKSNYISSIANGVCPRCGGKLVTRNGKYGNFLGCANYPNCRFTYK